MGAGASMKVGELETAKDAQKPNYLKLPAQRCHRVVSLEDGVLHDLMAHSLSSSSPDAAQVLECPPVPAPDAEKTQVLKRSYRVTSLDVKILGLKLEIDISERKPHFPGGVILRILWIAVTWSELSGQS
ncbi:unnamed protein product [Durusdinium trenchii]|uniref:Uncharacterized protein n=1 Tax=Durusdinium trenchii TaxID=1381693 RepID=A0ABP0IZQ5_9DINO